MKTIILSFIYFEEVQEHLKQIKKLKTIFFYEIGTLFYDYYLHLAVFSLTQIQIYF